MKKRRKLNRPDFSTSKLHKPPIEYSIGGLFCCVGVPVKFYLTLVVIVS